MTTLSPIEPDTTFHDLETLICDAVSMTDLLTNEVSRHFSKATPKGGFVIDAEDADRLFFLAGMVADMSKKTREAYYVAWNNEFRANREREGRE
ncbi:hypothetical protein ASE37_21880 [Rhizobium sp. Root268]|nr:hypothetical protein ASE37_21880 [Rhizobium sp. Root268]